MNAPRGLSPDARRAWTVAVAGLEVLGVDPATQAGRLERYARASGVLARLEADWEQAGCPTTTAGSRDQLAPHPLLREMRDQARLVELIATELAPRGVSGWRRGQARSPDRRTPARRRSGKVVPLGPPLAARRLMGDNVDAG